MRKETVMGLLSNIFGRNIDKDNSNKNSGNNSQNDLVASYIDMAKKCEQDQNAEAAIEWYAKAAVYNHPIGLYKMGIYYKNTNESASAFEYLKKAADLGHGEACYFIAQYYMNGEIVPKDEVNAFNYYKKSAELGDEAGQAYLGMFYLDGIGTSVDEKKAFYWLSRCSDIDWSGLGLCKCYLYGKGTLKDINKGINILMDIARPQSSNLFVKEARQLVRKCSQQGLPVPDTFISEIDAADKRESDLLDELIASFDETQIIGEEEPDNIIVLTNEDGDDINYEFLDLIEYEGQSFIVLLPINEDADEVIILKVEMLDDNQENYVSVDDDDLLNKLFSIFKTKNSELFEFTD